MSNYNKVILIGNLTRDVELKHIPSGQAVAQIGLAVNRKYKTKDGQQQEETTFIDCEAWGRTAEVMQQYLSKGKPVFIEGRLKLDTWQDKDGSNRSKLKVVIENFQFIDSKSDSAAPAAVAGGNNTDVDDSSIPF
jgi:single-strand DNA-binding protein